MPGRDGTGPVGSGGRGGRGAGRGFGPPDECLCPKCGEKIKHTRGVPCAQQQCPKCGASMVRA